MYKREREVRKMAKELGLELRIGKGKHPYRLYLNGAFVGTAATTASCHRADKNLLTELKKRMGKR